MIIPSPWLAIWMAVVVFPAATPIPRADLPATPGGALVGPPPAGTAGDCGERCAGVAGVAYTECRDQGGTPVVCVELAGDMLVTCLDDTCGPTPLLPSCELECQLAGTAATQECLLGGGEHADCLALGVSIRLECLEVECGTTCPELCDLHGQNVFLACLEDGGEPLACAMQQQAAVASCNEQLCGLTVACETSCYQQAGADLSACQAVGGTADECAAVAQHSIDTCLLGMCGIDPGGPACEDQCAEAAAQQWNECVGAGGTPADCTIATETEREACVAACGNGPWCTAYCPRVHADVHGDAIARPTDPAPGLPFDPEAHRLPDIIEVRLGRWSPTVAHEDPFTGEHDPLGPFVRLDLVVDGLVNPPGSADPEDFDPFEFGPHPIFGFVEIDIDGSVATGGETAVPQFRYVSNVGRFGGLPARPQMWDRVARDDTANDGDITTAPFVDRSGEDFHLALLGSEIAGINEIDGDDDGVFEAGERWILLGPLFHRAHGYEPFSFVQGGRVAGEYAPISHLQFGHAIGDNRTTISLVVPHSNLGAGLLADEPPEPVNDNPTDQASVIEALIDLQFSALFLLTFPTGLPEEALILDWAMTLLENVDDPLTWQVNVLVGSSHTAPDPTGAWRFLWSDVYPSPVPDDFDGNGFVDDADVLAHTTFVEAHDAADGLIDGVVNLEGFATNFSLFDVDYDGRVDGHDLLTATGDTDLDGDVDIADAAMLQRCFGAPAGYLPCSTLDFNGNDVIDGDDGRHFGWVFGGPVPE